MRSVEGLPSLSRERMEGAGGRPREAGLPGRVAPGHRAGRSSHTSLGEHVPILLRNDRIVSLICLQLN
jgi:hypothetical protein